MLAPLRLVRALRTTAAAERRLVFTISRVRRAPLGLVLLGVGFLVVRRCLPAPATWARAACAIRGLLIVARHGWAAPPLLTAAARVRPCRASPLHTLPVP